MMEHLEKPGDDPYFIVFSDDWGTHPSSSQHIFRHIARTRRVEWINTVGMRRPRLDLSDLRKSIQKLIRMLAGTSRGSTHATTGLTVISPLMLPFNTNSLIRRFNISRVKRVLKGLTRKYNDRDAIIVTTVPNACDYVDLIRTHRVVYYCVDDFSEWPGLDKELVLEMESALVKKSDVFLATSPALFTKLKKTGRPTFMLTHGVDLELFASEADTEHRCLADIPQPRVVYFGLFDARSDQELIGSIAAQMPNVSFVIAGRVETSIATLSAHQNIHFVGPIPYEQLPMLIKGADILFTAYRVNALTEALSPLKFKEYLATGRPIVSTPIAAAMDCGRDIHVASTPDEWVGVINHLMSADIDKRRQETVRELASESWDEKAVQLLRACSI